MGITITDVKIVGLCSKCRKKGDEIMKDKHGRIYNDNELSCVGCALGKDNTQQPDVKKFSPSLGEGECTGVSKKTTGSLENGKSKQYPSAETKDPIEDWLKNYKEFKDKCWRQGLVDVEEIVLLYKIL